MPADFTKCVSEGGRVTTKRVNENQYMHICWDKNGKSHSGEVKEYKKLSLKRKGQKK